jgi:N-acetylneuraminate synthase
MAMAIAVAGRQIGFDSPPYVIAEVSCNHQGSIDRALEILRAAKVAGADAVKLQTFKPDTHTLDVRDDTFVIKGGLWDGRSLHDLYREAVTPWEWHSSLFEEGARLGIPVFSSPGSEAAVQFLEELDCPAYKVSSFEAVDLPLIERIARTGKPTIISTGVTGREEIAEAVAAFRNAGGKHLALLHCVSAYPAPAEEFNLRTIGELGRVFDVVTGLSDHTLGSAVAIAAVAHGASIIEKHVTLRRSDGGLDAAFSAEPEELRQLVDGCRTAWLATGEVHFGPTRSSEGNRLFRRSIYVARDIAAGETLTAANLCMRCAAAHRSTGSRSRRDHT